MKLCTNAACMNISSQCLRLLINLLKIATEDPKSYLPLMNSVFDSLYQILGSDSQREIFAFNGKPDSGIGLLAKKTLPSAGYGFVGFIRVERSDFLREPGSEKMTIFKLGASKQREIEFFVQNSCLNYQVLF